MELGFLTHSIAAVAFLALTALLLHWRARPSNDDALTGAVAFTAIWAAAVAVSSRYSMTGWPAVLVLEVTRDASWLIYLTGALVRGRPERERRWPLFVAAIVTVCCIVIAADFYALLQLSPADRGRLPNIIFVGHLMLTVLGLMLIENLFRNTPESWRWNFKLMCFAVGGLFAYDFFLYSHAILFGAIDPMLLVARGMTSTLMVPMLVLSELRNRTARRRFTISRRIAFHTATLTGAGVYLLLMASAGYYIRQFGGNWGSILQVAFLFGAILLLLVSLFSGSFRAYLRTFIEKNFFAYKYDYREEWLRFIRTISGEADADLPVRVIKAVGDIVDSPDGGIWLRRADRNFALTASWNMSRWQLPEADAVIEADSALAGYLGRVQWTLDLDQLERQPAPERSPALPDWLHGLDRAWIIVPLARREQLYGIMILGRPRAPRELSWEDYDLLNTVGQQAASYLGEHLAVQALVEAKQFDEFNRRFAFVVHDIKNLVSQLSLIVSNAEKYSQDAEFQRDMLHTVQTSVEKMRRLLSQLHGQAGEQIQKKVVDLAEIVRAAASLRLAGAPTLTLETVKPGIAVAADEERLRAVVDHLVQNAIDAVEGQYDGQVIVRLTSEGNMAVIEVEDNGPGMEPAFIRDHLFRPFKTTKGVGYGIGAYESREFAQAMGGRLDVLSELGMGTLMRMYLPVVQEG